VAQLVERWSLTGELSLSSARPAVTTYNIYIFIHQNMIERTEQKVQQKSTHKKEKKTTTIEQVTQIYII